MEGCDVDGSRRVELRTSQSRNRDRVLMRAETRTPEAIAAIDVPVSHGRLSWDGVDDDSAPRGSARRSSGAAASVAHDLAPVIGLGGDESDGDHGEDV